MTPAKAIHMVLAFFSLWACIPGCEAFRDDPRQVSLIVVNVDDSNSEDERYQHLLKYEFENGELAGTETILSNAGGQCRFNQEESRVYRNRYVITDFGDVVDLRARDFIHRGGSGSEYTRLLGVEGDQVYIHRPQAGTYYFFDLVKQETVELTEPGKWALPGQRSPDGSMSLVYSECSTGQIWLHELSGDTVLLGEGFFAEYSPLSSILCGAPVLWLDNQRILTQRANGILVILSVDGSVEPLLTIDLGPYDFAPAGWNGAMHVRLVRDAEYGILYDISLIGPDGKFRSNRFVIDVENKSYTVFDPEWVSLGHGFDYATTDGITVLRHQGSEIGQEEFFMPRQVRTIEGHLATLSRNSHEYPQAVKVWSRASGAWTRMDFEYPVWILYSAIIGWVE